MTTTGLEQLLRAPERWLRPAERIGLLTNHTGVDRRLRSAIDRLHSHPDVTLVRLYGPEHGLRGDAQAGAPVVPSSFEWRGETHVAVAMLEQWKESSPCSHGSDEIYLRKHWYRVKTDAGIEMTVYFQRQPASRARARDRWYLYSIVPAE